MGGWGLGGMREAGFTLTLTGRVGDASKPAGSVLVSAFFENGVGRKS